MCADPVTIWAYSSVIDGPETFKQPYIIVLNGAKDVEIEPSMARSHAIRYLERMASIPALELVNVKDKRDYAGVIAYTAHLSGTMRRGVMDESRRVLVGLLTEFCDA